MYNDLKDLYYKNGSSMFAMAVSHLLDVGFRHVKQITDDDIAKLDGNGLITQSFVQDLVRLAREIANTCDTTVEIIQFCMVEEVFDTSFYSKKRPIRWDRLSEIADHAISYILYDTDDDDLDGIDWALQDADLDLDDEEREFFGIPVREEEED